ncbi:MAG: hypothetical protein RIB45_06035 [Marivibrio sp.]|uniref:hypothetical protein n=1 Tax=Marivibrio sp. TaxID=2039719 RepID=UPI0032EDC711
MTSFAKSVSPSPITAESPRTDFENAKESCETRSQSMIERDAPHPAPRPSPDLADEADRATFNEKWAREQRRAAFIQMRTEPKTGGRIRTLNKSFNR